MSSFAAAQDRDANRQVISSGEAFKLESTWTFVGATTGANGAHTLFTVTGNVFVDAVFGICDTDLTVSGGTPTMSVGTVGNTGGLLSATTATLIDDGDVWVDSTPRVGVGSIWGTGDNKWNVVNDGADIILTISSDTVDAGVIDFYCLWRPLSSDGLVEVTTPA